MNAKDTTNVLPFKRKTITPLGWFMRIEDFGIAETPDWASVIADTPDWASFIKEAMVLDCLPVGVLLSDDRGAYVWVNKHCAETLGYSVTEISLHKNVFDVVARESYRTICDQLENLHTTSTVPWFEVTFRHRNKMRRKGRVTSAKTDLDGIELWLTVVIFDPVSDTDNENQLRLF